VTVTELARLRAARWGAMSSAARLVMGGVRCDMSLTRTGRACIDPVALAGCCCLPVDTCRSALEELQALGLLRVVDDGTDVVLTAPEDVAS
jgi:hypothetical protein